MKRMKFTVFTLCILCLVAFVFCSCNNGDSEEECNEIKSHAKVDCKIVSILGKVQEYQNKLIMYRKMFLAAQEADLEYREKHKDKVSKKLEGFIAKLTLGNDFSCMPEDKDNKLTIEDLVQIWTAETKAKFWFELASITFYNQDLPSEASEYSIDCTADVTLIFHHVTEHNQNYKINMKVDHMKSCEPD